MQKMLAIKQTTQVVEACNPIQETMAGDSMQEAMRDAGMLEADSVALAEA